MKSSLKLSAIAVIALIAASLPAQAQHKPYAEGTAPQPPRAVGDPLKRLYRFSGVTNTTHAANAGIATSVHCTSFSTVAESLQFNIRDFNGNIVTRTTTIQPFNTVTASTHFTVMFFDDINLIPGVLIDQGSMNVLATNINIFCSAMIVDAGAAVPQGIALHMVRYNPVPNTTE